jgi:Protein of unknown function (DUF433)
MVAGTSVSVQRIAGWYKLGPSPEEIAENFGHVSLAQVHAARTTTPTARRSMGTSAMRTVPSEPVHFLPVSMIFTSGPREIFAMNPRFECCWHRRDILSRAERTSAAASSPVSDEDVMLKNRNFAAMTACFSSWLYRIRSSRVMTTHRFAPASLSQSTSCVP